MQALLGQISASLVEWAWCGSRIDEATHLVLQYCYAKLPTRSTEFASRIAVVCFAPTIERIFLQLWNDTVFELTEDLLIVQKFKINGSSGRFLFNPVSRRLVTIGSLVRKLTPRWVQSLPASTHAFAIDGSTGDMFLVSRPDPDSRSQFKVTRVNHQLDELDRFVIDTNMVYGIFFDGGLLAIDHSGSVSVYAANSKRKLHQFHTPDVIVHLDANRRHIYLRRGDSRCAVDFDGRLVEARSSSSSSWWFEANSVDRLSNNVVVTGQLCEDQCALRLAEPVIF